MSIPAHRIEGDGDTAVFLLHGVGGAKEAWRDNAGAIAAAGFKTVAWDMPGYGASQTIAPYTLQRLAQSLAALIEHIGARRNVLLGHSMGGMVAQEAAVLCPDKLQALLLVATSPAFGKPGGDWQAQFLRSRFAPLDAGIGMVGLAAQLVPAMVAPSASAKTIDAAATLMAQVPEVSYRAALAAIVGFDRLAWLARIRVPTLCLAGEHDTNAAPAVLQKMAQHIPHAEYLCLPGVGHLANIEQPAVFNAAIVNFLCKHFPR
jgi:3-oxoadipate enol-lactonase